MVGKHVKFPTPYLLEVYTAGEPTVDLYGNKRPGKGQWKQVQVASWWVDRTEEKTGDSVLRTVDYIHVHIPADEQVSATSRIRLPDGSIWEVMGNPENYRHGWHGWDPGLVVIHGKKVTG